MRAPPIKTKGPGDKHLKAWPGVLCRELATWVDIWAASLVTQASKQRWSSLQTAAIGRSQHTHAHWAELSTPTPTSTHWRFPPKMRQPRCLLLLPLLLILVGFIQESAGLKCWHTGKTTAVSLIILQAIKSPIFSIWYPFLAHPSSKFPKCTSFENSTNLITGLCFGDQREICASELNLERSLWNPVHT